MGNWGSVPLGEATELVSVVPLEAEGGQLWGPSNLPHPPLQPVTVVQLGSLWSVSMEALRAKGTWTEHTSRATLLHFIRRGTKVQDNGGTGRAVSTLAYQCCPSTHMSPPTSTTAYWGPVLDCRLPGSVRTLRTLLC